MKKLILFITLLFLVCFSNDSLGQSSSSTYADKSHYLIDSLDLNKIKEKDKIIIDSCLNVFHKTKIDSVKLNAINNIIRKCSRNVWSKYNVWRYEFSSEKLKTEKELKSITFLKRSLLESLMKEGYLNAITGKYEESIEFYNRSLKIQKELNDSAGIAKSYNNIGYNYEQQGKTEKTKEHYLKSLNIQKSIGNKSGIASGFNNLASIYISQGIIEKALEYNYKSLKIQEELDNKKGIAVSLNNIAYLYSKQGQNDKSIEYFKKSLKIRENTGDNLGVARVLNNIGSIYNSEGEIVKALDYYHKSLKLREEIADKPGVAVCYNNIGALHKGQGDMEKALEYYHKALLINKEVGKKRVLAPSYNNIGAIYLKQGNIQQAYKYCSQAHQVALEVGNPEQIKETTGQLYQIAQNRGDFKTAFNMFQMHIEMRDSLNNKATYKASIQQNAKYIYEKKTTADSIINAEAEKIHLANLAAEEAKSEKQALEVTAQKKQKWFLYIGLGLVAVFAMFMFNRFKVTQKQKNVIDAQKQVVEEQKASVESQKEQIEQQHQHLEETHQEISDSIKYAERLQLAILPPMEDMKANLGESFVLFQPKDVVSGDFYWMQNVNDQILFAAADCTGHGVPGAMVSVVCSNALNRSVKEFGLLEPKDILDKTRELVIETFARSGKDVKDGMDIALCSLSKKENKLVFGGANNPLWIVRKTEFLTEIQKEEKSSVLGEKLSLIEYKASKQPIGLYEGMKDFEQNEIPIFEGDSLYLFTDGFADQFGGVKGKKFKYRPFKKHLIDINNLDMDAQLEAINLTFNEWKGSFEQVDDVCIIGLKV